MTVPQESKSLVETSNWLSHMYLPWMPGSKENHSGWRWDTSYIICNSPKLFSSTLTKATNIPSLLKRFSPPIPYLKLIPNSVGMVFKATNNLWEDNFSTLIFYLPIFPNLLPHGSIRLIICTFPRSLWPLM